MFNGRPADYPDISDGLTFRRVLTEILTVAIDEEEQIVSTILAASGFGKTTCARQALLALREKGARCFEHAPDHKLQWEAWADIAEGLTDESAKVVLFVDDAHQHLQEINRLSDKLSNQQNRKFYLLLASSPNLWGPRIKAAPIFKEGKEYTLKKLSATEIESLLNLLERQPKIRNLVSRSFSGFSKIEQKRRLEVKCESEPFVCLKNIFASENFDDIILKEFAELENGLQEIYRVVAAMEDAGVRVHRQLVIRMLGIQSDAIPSIIASLEGIVSEYTIDEREAVYGWRGRHPVIVGIVAEYKYFDTEKHAELLRMVIDNLSPSYEIEVKTIRDICTIDNGVRRIADREVQNNLYQKLISLAPNERVPRHRLIRNLIAMDEFEQAETEIRIFENDFRQDGAVARYKISLAVRRANRAKGLMDEDRIAILLRTLPFARSRTRRYRDNKYFLREFVSLGFEIFKRTGDTLSFDEALDHLKAAHDRLGDPDIWGMIRSFENEMTGKLRNA